jgi:hypothetical protein
MFNEIDRKIIYTYMQQLNYLCCSLVPHTINLCAQQMKVKTNDGFKSAENAHAYNEEACRHPVQLRELRRGPLSELISVSRISLLASTSLAL